MLSPSRVRVIGGLALVVALLVGLQIYATRQSTLGPLESLWHDYAGTPKSMTLPWAGLLLAMVGLSWRRRFIALGAAVAIDALYAIPRWLESGVVAVGNGPVIVLTGIVVVACWRWTGVDRRNALYAAALGALLILATKVGDIWLGVTIHTQPLVLDEYVMLADHALGQPSWHAARILEALGPKVEWLLHWVYIELPAAAAVVAVWQLRGVARTGRWPSHYLVRTFLVLGLVGPLFYVLFPVIGPMFAFGPEGGGAQFGDYWPGVLPPIDLTPAPLHFDGGPPRNCMPSMHTAWALAVFLHSRRDVDGSPAPLWMRTIGSLWLVCTLAATLGFGYHYGVDLVAGAVLCLTIDSALRDPARGWGAPRIRLVAGGSVLFATLLVSYRYLAVPMAHYPVLAGALVLGALVAFAGTFYLTWFGDGPLRAFDRLVTLNARIAELVPTGLSATREGRGRRVLAERKPSPVQD
ncbi:phosphatase PAP2 family protein [Gordonia sp. ABSL49_1]|uniref:phosphatase PAP2 family protein n=1 Tax=Gordonia sp. ABSL49_1 TaxID=2920941 RepID=UPI001F111F2C|nr:phosphatase PAP2 family protein [Gordonia sp. ABSL49_1]MCH5643424.1 phosphatase PAP2 family protein [Gordonia sp. ABSL49_1]